ncbi:TPA: flagellar biosynthesis protein FlhB [Candidatus Poribacteria bacterium]|nr:flagellar biosynthesis protein FlhB [Candidatus Poribacteria bacterium]
MPEGTDQEERTESATPRKREEARRKGQVALSNELVSSFMFLIGLTAIRLVFPSIFSDVKSLMENTLSNLSPDEINPENMSHYGIGTIFLMGKMFAPFALIMIVSALAINFAQVGFFITFETLIPKFDRIDPIKGFQRFVSKRTFVMLTQSLLKVVVVGYVLYITINSQRDKILALAVVEVKPAIIEIVRLTFKMGFRVAFLLFIISVFDYAYQRWEYERSLKMTREEVKEEMRSTEGDPLVKSRIRSIQRELAMRRMMQEVPSADVVITNPTHLAVALRYKQDVDKAPKVCAKGQNLIAERIKEIAREHYIPIIEDKPLAQMLFKLELDQEIPSTLYKAVAEILAKVYQMSNRKMQ